MIATENQLRVTKDRLERFSQTFAKLTASERNDDPVARARISAVQEQIGRLRAEMNEYEALRSGEIREFFADTLLDLPAALIKARISRSLSQSGLAELIGVKPQQVQRWEAEGYRKVSLERLEQIAKALKVRISKRIVLTDEIPVTISQVRRGLSRIGLPTGIINRRLIPTSISDDSGLTLVDELDARLNYLYGVDAIAMSKSTQVLEGSQLRFKLPRSANQNKTRAYAYYVAGLCRIAAKTVSAAPRSLPSDWRAMREILFLNHQISLERILDVCWDHGISVLALNDPLAFHGACWREDHRTVIVLKQNSAELARWIVDLLHEMYHAANPPSAGDFTIFEDDETSPVRRESQDELRAQRFASEVVTNGRTEALTTMIVNRSGGEGAKLKQATIAIADESGVPVGILGNLLAHRLAENNFNWWGVAASLQSNEDSPWKRVRKVFFEFAKLQNVSRFERDLLMQALET